MNELQKEYFERVERERAEAEAAEEARLLKVMEAERAKEALRQAEAEKAAKEAERKAEEEAEQIINTIKAKIDADKMKAEAEKQKAEAEKQKEKRRDESRKRFAEDQKAKQQEQPEEVKAPEVANDDAGVEGDIYEREPVGEASMPKKSPKFKKGGKKSSGAEKIPQRPQPQEAVATTEPVTNSEEEKPEEKTKQKTQSKQSQKQPEQAPEKTDAEATEEVAEAAEVVEDSEIVEAAEVVEDSEIVEDAESVEDSEITEKATPESKAAADREAKLQEQADEWQDKYKRLLAEFENARAREAKEASRMYDMGAKAVLEKLLPVVDNFERAIQTIPEEDKERAFEQGVDKIYKQMLTTLEGIGVTPMNAEGTEFNPDLHNAVMHVEDEAYGENVVAEEMQKGYMYKDSVLRYSMVKVAN